MTNQNQNNAAQAANDNPLSDEYVNAIIQRHGYDSPECVIARLHQWIGLHGGENGVTLLMYETHKALSKLRAPVAPQPFRAAFANGVLPATRFHELWQSAAPSKNSSHTMMEDLAWQVGKFASLVAAEVRTPVADERELHEAARAFYNATVADTTVRITTKSSEKRDAVVAAGERLRAALASAPVAGEALDTLTITLEWDDGKSDQIEVHGTEKMLRRLQVWLDRKRGLFHEATPVAGKALGWRVRERRSTDGELLDCFVEAPKAAGMAYALEVLGDDYNGYGDVEGKLKHCQMIVAWANAAPQASEAVRNAALEDRAAIEAMAHLCTIANFGGTLEQAKDLAARGIQRCAAISATQPEQGERDA